MAADKKFLARSVQKKEQFFALYSAATNMPFVICDPESFNDQVWLFDTAEQLQDFAKSYTEEKTPLKGIQYPNKNFLGFFSMLYTIGVNELVFVGENGKQTLLLEDLVRRPDYSNRPKEQQPILNPELQLTGLYFMQEATRQVPNEEKKKLPELEEELCANMMKARYMMPIELLEGPESDVDKLKQRKFRLPILKNKNGDVMQPIFTDPNEFKKFNKENKFQAIAVPFNNLKKLMIKDVKAYLLNPMGFHIAMSAELLDGIDKSFEI